MKRKKDDHPLREYLASLTVDQQAAYAAACGTTVGYLRKYLSKGTKLDIKLVVELVRHSKGRVPFCALRSDVDWSVVRRYTTPRETTEA